jgi:hypothetical protein
MNGLVVGVRFSYHTDLNMDTVVTALRTLFQVMTRVRPRFRLHGGSGAENLALQNIQARLRMVIAYFFAQLLPWARGHSLAGCLCWGARTLTRGGCVLEIRDAVVDASVACAGT